MDVNAYVINMAEAQKRKRFLDIQFLNFPNLNVEYIEGVNINGFKPLEIAEVYNEQKAYEIIRRPMVKSEIGCGLSHIKAYRKIVENNIPYAIVMEDDILMSSYFNDILPDVINWVDPDKSQIVLFTPCFSYCKKDGVKLGKPYQSYTTLGPQHYLYPAWGVTWYAACYLVTNKAAQNLMNNLYPVFQLADAWDYIMDNKLADVRVVLPTVISFTKEGRFVSSLQNERTQILQKYSKVRKRSILEKLKISFKRRVNRVTKVKIPECF
jgi:glycosyl transferase, family 25